MSWSFIIFPKGWHHFQNLPFILFCHKNVHTSYFKVKINQQKQSITYLQTQPLKKTHLHIYTTHRYINKERNNGRIIKNRVKARAKWRGDKKLYFQENFMIDVSMIVKKRKKV